MTNKEIKIAGAFLNAPAIFQDLCVEFPDQRFEDRQAFLDHFIADTVADPEIFGTAETGTYSR